METVRIIIGAITLLTGIHLIAYCVMMPGVHTLQAILGGVCIAAYTAIVTT